MHPSSCPPAAPTACPTYLDTLNDAQRAAALHGTGTGADDGPLLVIAGAGSGKTNTLAHRVAHLLAQGADPGRILLLTFSRRAADEMTRRVQRIAAKVSPATPAWPAAVFRGRAPFTASAPDCCGNSPGASASTRPSPSTTGKTPPT